TRKRVRADQVEPQSGVIYRWTGAESPASGWKVEKAFAILVRQGENPESARKKAREFFAQGSAELASGEWQQLELKGEGTSNVKDSVDFHPESGVELTEARPFNLMFK